MKNADEVAALITDLKKAGKPLAEVAWKAALACVGWAYVFGARGEYCTVANRKKYYASKGSEHPTIKTACKAFDGGSCSGCKWYPGGKKTRVFDCRGFTYWVLLQVYGWKLMGAGATAQWNTASNWKAKGEISTMPKDTLVCLFVQKGKTMSHTGFGLNNETVECSAGVQHFTSRNKKWTHWGVPACLDGTVSVDPSPAPVTDSRPTLRSGSKGAAVAELQTLLKKLGYGLGPCGIDGDYGRATEAAVRSFQYDHKLDTDGVCGPKTWKAIDAALKKLDNPDPVKVTYTVTVTGLSLEDAKKIAELYPKAEIREGGV